MAIPKIRMRGIRASIPPGFILGRVGSGRGEVQLLGLSDLTKAGVATTSAVAAAVPIIADGDLLANTSGAAAQPVATTLTALLDYVFANVEGGILYRGASAWVALAKGTSGYILTQGASDPSWQPAPSGGGTVTSVVAGAGLTGGTITTTGTIALSIPVSIANGGTASTSAAAAVSALGAAGVGVVNTFTASNVFQALTYVSRFAGANPTASSQAILSVSGDSGAQSSELYVYGATPQYRTYQAGGSHTALTQTTSGTDLADYDFYGYNGGTSAYAQGARVAAQSTESWTSGHQGTKLYFQTTPNGTTTASNSFQVGQDASIQAGYSQVTIYTAGGSLVLPVSIVSALPSAATEGNGAMRIVTDALAPALGQTVTGGGSVRVIVNSDGTNWRA